MSNINPNIFKAYDIRGVYPTEINEEAARQIGWAFAEFLGRNNQVGNRRIVVGRDMRLSSDDLAEALIQALVSQSFDVINIGRVSSPLFYWALISRRAAGGLMITASHNPAEYNGLKICGEAARPIAANSGLNEIKETALREKPAAISVSPGSVIDENPLAEYLEFMKNKIDFNNIKPLKIIIDCGNGMMGPEIEKIFIGGLIKAEIMFGEPDGNFPNHEADPVKEKNLTDLKRAVKEKKADLGAAFDGDGDRIIFVDEKGESIRGDFITALIAGELLRKNQGAKIFYEVRSSRAVPEIIVAAGGVPILGRPGHALIKTQMRRENILFGGEMSGHYFFRDLGFVDNGLFTLFLITKIIGERQRPFSEIIAPLKKYFIANEINFKISNADELLKKAEEKFGGGQIKKIDGLTVEYPDWWFNLRKSNTEPLARLNLEADTKELMERKLAEIKALIEENQ